jgi:hypothetical protein
MLRCFLAALFMAGIILATGLPDSAAQEKKKKAQPKKERIAIADPKEAQKDPDFEIQGEYEGTKLGSEEKVGAQVIALGQGKFNIKLYRGGLSGAGWDGKSPPVMGKASRSKDEPRAYLDRGKDVVTGIISTGSKPGTMIFTASIGDEQFPLSKAHRKSKTLGAKPSEGAVVLFAKPGDESNWTKGKLLELSDGKFLTVAGTGSIKSKQSFGDFKAHIEFRTPWMPDSFGQARGNSGVYIQDRYECQVLDSFGLSGENNECGGIYTQHKPLVNMCYPPLSWQTYDIEFTPAVFEGSKKVKNARATIYHNGVKIHDNVEFPKECPGGQKEGPAPGPFQFQDHGNPVVYRNVWVISK